MFVPEQLTNIPMAYLCECNNCGTTLLDENPQVNAMDHKISMGDAESMLWIDEGHYNFDGIGYWACPRCETDAYLVDYDNLTQKDVEHYLANMKLALDSESVNIYVDEGEDKDPIHIVYWHEDEWLEDPQSVSMAMVNAVHLFHTDKKLLLKKLGYIK